MGEGRQCGIVGVCLLCACAFEVGSADTSGMLEDTDAATSSSSGNSSERTDGTGAKTTGGGSQSGSGGGSSGPASSEGADETTAAIDPSEGNPPRADLVFVQEGPVDLGVLALSGPIVLTLQLTNHGEAAASAMDGDEPPSPLRWAGGAFPGTDGTCQGMLPPGDTCTITLAVGPGQPGYASGPVAVHFDDDVGSGTTMLPVELTASGQGPNLIENPDAESDPQGTIITGWDAGDSSFRTTTQHNHGAGSLSFFAGGSENPEISQDLVLDPWSASIDELGLRFVFTGWTRANDDFWNDDPHGVSFTFLDDTGAVLGGDNRGGMTHDGWESTSFDAPIPVATRRIRLRLSCDRNDALINNNNCSAWFDDFSGRLVYAPPQ